MTSNSGFNETPNHFMVLDAISRGIRKIDSIAKVTKLSRDEVELIVNDLITQRLIVKSVKKGFFGNKKVEIDIVKTGIELLNTKKQELYEKSERLQQLYETGDKGQMQTFMDSNRMWIPMMLFSGIMNMMFFASMMTFMGMAMNPSESAMTEGQIDQSSGADGTSTETGDAGSSDMDSGAGEADFSGFDGGGFGDF